MGALGACLSCRVLPRLVVGVEPRKGSLRCKSFRARSPARRSSMTFQDLALPPDLVAALEKQNIVAPTPVQVAAMPILLAGKDVYLNSETGTGKTLAYLLPIDRKSGV